jgi:uncharacterized protein HemY
MHLEAAEGWLGLGDSKSAAEELEQIEPRHRGHPDVLMVRHDLYAKVRKWEMAAEIAQTLCNLAPDEAHGYFHLAYALHELKHTKQAWDTLISVADKFPDHYLIAYNLACYACQLGNLDAARAWLRQAMDRAGEDKIRALALGDPDLKSLQAEIRKMKI